MKWQRIAVLGVLGATLAALLARAATPVPPTHPATPPVLPASDTASLYADVERLRARLRPPASRATPTRNLFAFRQDESAVAKVPPPSAMPVPTPMSQMAPVAARLTWRMIGLAEDLDADGRRILIAIVSADSGVHLLKVGDRIDRHRVVAVGPTAVELATDEAATPVVLTLE